LCTCNFLSEAEIKKVLGPAMYSRIGCCIEYTDLSIEQKNKIIDSWYKEILKRLDEHELEFITQTDIIEWFKENVNRFDNIRLLKTRLENAVYDELASKFILN
jgi:ATP-dependent Clp protease ATP-binding subunit ClpA